VHLLHSPIRSTPEALAATGLRYAAAPVFAAMAIVQCLCASSLCTSVPGAFPLTDMGAMYLLMSLFHLSPWLTLLASQANHDTKENLQ